MRKSHSLTIWSLCVLAFALSCTGAKAQRTFNPGNPANPYGLPILPGPDDELQSNDYLYMKWGIMMSDGELYYSAPSRWLYKTTPLTQKSNLFFLNHRQSNTITPESEFAARDVQWVLSGLTIPYAKLPEENAVLMRKYHFPSSLQNVRGTGPTYPPISPSNKKAVILIHGWNPSSDSDAYDNDEFLELKLNIRAALNFDGASDWALVTYHWERDSDTGPKIALDGGFAAINGTEAAEAGHRHGQHLGERIETLTQSGIEKVHFIAHSAGTWVARSAARHLLKSRAENTTKPPVKIQITLLDPFIPGDTSVVVATGGKQCNLKRTEINSIPNFQGASTESLVRLENYYANEALVLGTSGSFAWDSSIPQVNTLVGNEGATWLDPFGGHSGPIRFYSDTLAVSTPNVASSIRDEAFNRLYRRVQGGQRLSSDAFLEQNGWRRSMFYREPVVVKHPEAPPTPVAVGSSVPFTAGAVLRGNRQPSVYLAPDPIEYLWETSANGTTWTTQQNWHNPPTGTSSFTLQNVTASMDNLRVRAQIRTRAGYEVTNAAILRVQSSGGGTTPGVTVPATPANLAATGTSSSSISLAWQDKSNNESGFRIERKTGAGGSWAAIVTNNAANSTTHTDSGLGAATTYFYRVAAFNSAGGSNTYSNEASATTQAAAGTNHTLSIQSSNPASGVNVYSYMTNGTGGLSGVTPVARSFPAGTSVIVSALATLPGGQQFQKWQLDGADHAHTLGATVVMNGPRTLTAVYGSSAPPTRTLTSLSISGPGTVNEGSSAQFTATAYFSDGTQQTVSPSPWGTNFGAPGTISSAGVFTAGAVTSDIIVTINASYTSGGVPKYATKDIVVRRVASQQTFTLTTNAVHGSITRSPNLPSYSAGSAVVVTVTANPGYFFANWTGASTSNASSLTVVMDSNKTLTAQFGTGSAPGGLQVNITPPQAVAAGAQWRMGNHDIYPWNNSGSVETPTHNGDFFIQLKEIPGWTRPWPGAVKISTGVTTVLNVSYLQQPGALQVVLHPADAIAAGAQWRVDGGPWQNSGASLNVAPGSRSIEFKTAGSWTTPAPQGVTVTANQAAVIHGNYAPPLGQPVIASISPPNGPLEGETAVTIEGVNFAPGAVVKFGGVNASQVIFNSSSSITAFTPPNNAYVTVPVSVTVGTQTATNPNGFTYVVPRGNNLDLLGQVGGSVYAVKLTGNLAWIGEASSLVAINIANPSSLSPVGRIGLPDMVRDIAFSGNYAFVAAEGSGIQVVDITNPNAPAVRGFFDTPGEARCIRISGSRAYIADGSSGLQILDISQPERITKLGSIKTPGNALWLEIVSHSHGTYALIADRGNGMQVVNVTNPNIPTLGSALPTGGSAVCLAIHGNYLYVGDGVESPRFGLTIFNVSDPRVPHESGFWTQNWPCETVCIDGNHLWTGYGFLVHYLSLANPTQPTLSAVAPLNALGTTWRMVAFNKMMYAADSNGLKVIDVSNVSQPVARGSYLSAIRFSKRHHSNGGNAFVADDTLGLRCVSLTNPAVPSLVGTRVVTYPQTENIFLSGSYCHLVLGGGGVQTIDISNPTTPSLTSTFVPSEGTTVFDFCRSGNVGAYSGSTVQTQSGRFGLLDMSNPASPSLRGQIDLSGSGGFQPAWGVTIKGSFAYVANWDMGMRIIDISNINSPAIRGSFAAPNTRGVAISNDGNFAYLASGDGFRVINITNPNSPSFVSKSLSDVYCFDVAVSGSLAFVAATVRGVVVFDLSEPATPVEVASYDTPWSAWGVDVQGDIVTVSDGYGGLLVLGMKDVSIPTITVNPLGFDPSQPTASPQLALSGTASDNKSVVKVFWSNNQGGSGEADGTINWTAGPVQLYPGENVITVTAMDAAGNKGSASVTVLHSPPDETPPVIRVAQPESGSRVVTFSESFTLSGTANDNVLLHEVTWENDRGFSGTATGTSAWVIEDALLLEGDNVFTVTARDLAGNAATDRVTLARLPPDDEEPTLTIQFPTLDPAFESTTNSLSLGGVAADNTGLVEVRWQNHRGGEGVARGLENWAVDGISLMAGLNVILVTATDLAGNTSTGVLTVSHQPAKFANRPMAGITSPKAGARFEVETVEIRGNASARDGLSAVLCRVNDGPWQAAQGNAAWTWQAPLAPGPNFVRVRALDANGVESAEVSRLFTRVVTADLTVETEGEGAVAFGGFKTPGGLEIGRNYSLSAAPRKGWIFAGWSGGIVSSLSKISFTMREGLETTATFVENPFGEVTGAYLGLARSEPDSHEGNGLLRVTVASGGTFSASLDLGGKNYRLKGQFDSNGWWTGEIKRGKQPPLAAVLILGTTAGSDTLTGMISDGTNTSQILAERLVYHARDFPAPQAGQLTFAIDSSNEQAWVPKGYGAGILVVDAGGKTKLQGRLPDGTGVTFAGHVAKTGAWPLHVPLYQKGGSITGKMIFADVPESDSAGVLHWYKPQRPKDPRYSLEFETRPAFFAQRYTPPAARNLRILSLWDSTDGNGSLLLFGPEMGAGLAQLLNWQVDNRLSSDGSVVRITRWQAAPKTGLFSGAFLNPFTLKTLPISGALLQKTGEGLGWFQGVHQNGGVVLERGVEP